MGRKRRRSGKHVYLLIALLSLVTGCSTVKRDSDADEARESLLRANKLFAEKDYHASIREYERVLTLPAGRALADAAYFQLGLIHVDPENPDKDVQKAVECFNAVIAASPRTSVAEQARILVAVLDDSDKAKQELESSKQIVERSKLEIERSKQLVEKARQETEKTRQETERTRQEMEKSRQVMEKSKQVDIEIEQKRRERAR